ncbi:neuropeptide Y receptor activity protein [Homalodisca vitripennis]|nr:neuropeptide Y receptor activity protein [Homalodisca vitripennis]
MNVSNTTESMNWTVSATNGTEHFFNPETGYENWVPMSEEPIYEVPPHQVIILSFCYGSISVAAVLGNGLVMWVIATSRRMRSVTNYYIANLALADIVIGLFAIPFEFQSALLQRWIFPAFMCSFCPFVKVISVSVSVFTLAAIAVDRHRAILTPFTARVSKVQFKLVISFIWLISGLMGAPYLFAMGLVKMDNAGDKYMYCYHVNLSKETMLVYHGTLVLLQYLVPLTIITWVYARMGFALWGATAPGNAQTERDANIMRNKKKQIPMCHINLGNLMDVMERQITKHIMSRFWGARSIGLAELRKCLWFSLAWTSACHSVCFEWRGDQDAGDCGCAVCSLLASSTDIQCSAEHISRNKHEKFKREFQMRLRMPCTKQLKRSEPLARELSGLESSRFEWRRNSTINSKSSKLTSISLQ